MLFLFLPSSAGLTDRMRFCFVLLHWRIAGGKDKCMKISTYYEKKNRITVLEVPDGECRSFEERDYQNRLAQTGDKALVARRSTQQILEGDFDRPSFNRNQTESRRHVLLSAIDPQDRYLADETDLLSGILKKEVYEELYRAIENLNARQKKLLYSVFWERKKQSEIAKEEGVTEAAVAGRMRRIYAVLRKNLEEKNFF